MGRERLEAEIYETACNDMSMMMSELLMKYRGYPKFIAQAMTDSLASFVSITSDDPKKALEMVAKRIQTTDYNQVRREFTGWRLAPKPKEEGVPASD